MGHWSKKWRWFGAITAAACGLLFVQTLAASADDAGPAQVLGADAPDVIPGQYIVVLKDTASIASAHSTQALAADAGAEIGYEYDTAIKGFSAELSASALEEVLADPNVAYVEADRVMSISETQNNPTWGLDRVDQRNLPMDGKFIYDSNGSGVTTYVIDTGINTSHTEFSGRVASGYSAINDGRGTLDCHGHGTHVAGTVAGTQWGVAKRATVVPVRVLGCDGRGDYSGIIAGVNWVAQNAGGSAVANMSLGGDAVAALDQAVNNAMSRVTMVVAAGNENQNACNVSPARASGPITVGATDSSDTRASFSNWGTCVDVFAPGVNITSASHASNSGSTSMSGTSMASPHVAGIAALYLSANPGTSPQAVKQAIIAGSTPSVVRNPGSGSPNKLVYSRLTGGSTPPTDPTTPPTDPTTPPTDPGDCSAPAWNAGSIYNTGDHVSRSGYVWRAKWWTQGEEPGTTGQWGVWEQVRACDGNGNPPTTDPTTPPTDPTTPPTDPGDCSAPAWSSSTSYSPGDSVSYSGAVWNATWWSTGITPGSPIAYNIWEQVGTC